MGKQEKRELRIRKNPANVSLENFEALIRQYGYIKDSGSHPKARINIYTLPYKRENPIKLAYVKELLKIIDSL